MNDSEQTKHSKGRIALNKRIALKCLDCCGGSAKEVTLCHSFSCPLWAVRFGYPMRNKRYKERMEKARERFTEEFKELAELGIKPSNFLVEKHITVIPAD